ncbi:MAG: copper homeostasis protein CutC [Bacteroidales bacterium]|nr:copper homeostasis protein CutC [Bacteroidales bacterium]
MLWERCCVSYEQAVEAAAGRASRIELCRDLDVGGITPERACITECLSAGLPVNVLVRPRGGSFVFSEKEILCMLDTIGFCGESGVDGIVTGALLEDGRIDCDAVRAMVKKARQYKLSVTFHRAFDHCADPFLCLEDIISLGCDRILTSGQRDTAEEGKGLIAELVRRAAGRIVIMPGSGVTPDNAAQLSEYTGCVELHGTRLF